MRYLKHFLFSLVILPLVSLAAPEYSNAVGPNRTFNNVPRFCYITLRAAIELLPEISNEVSNQLGNGTTVWSVDDVVTPNGTDSVFEWEVYTPLYIPRGPITVIGAKGHYKLAQKYTEPTLYLEMIQYPAALKAEELVKLWNLIDNIMVTCAEKAPTPPGTP